MKKLQAKTTLDVHYQLIKDGVSDVIPSGSIVSVRFLKKPVCWCPVRPPPVPFHEVEDCVKTAENATHDHDFCGPHDCHRGWSHALLS